MDKALYQSAGPDILGGPFFGDQGGHVTGVFELLGLVSVQQVRRAGTCVHGNQACA